MKLLDKLKQIGVIPEDATQATIVSRNAGGDRITYEVSGKPYELAFDIACLDAKEPNAEH